LRSWVDVVTSCNNLFLHAGVFLRHPKELDHVSHIPDTAMQDATTEPRHPFDHNGHNIHNTVTDGLPGQPIATGQCLQRPASTRLRAEQHHPPHGSRHRRPACYHRCHHILTDYQTASSTVAPPVVEGVVPLRHNRKGLRSFARELSCSVGSTARTSGASLLWSRVTTKCCCRSARRQVIPHNMAT
jgi:hypothetical protein